MGGTALASSRSLHIDLKTRPTGRTRTPPLEPAESLSVPLSLSFSPSLFIGESDGCRLQSSGSVFAQSSKSKEGSVGFSVVVIVVVIVATVVLFDV